MKKLLILLALFLPLYAQAVNYLGFGGGNYVYAEQGNLYFNLDKNTFDHRKWTYDGEKFTSNISIKMDLKTKYTNEWYEEVLANKKSSGLMYANYIKQPFNYNNRGGYQRVFLPAAAWALGGFVARTAAFNAFRRYATGALVTVAAGLALNHFCGELQINAISCAAQNGVPAFSRTVTYAYELKEYGSHGIGSFTVRATPQQFETDNGLAKVVYPHVARTHANFGGTLKECVSKANDPVVSCNYPNSKGQDDWFDTNAFVGLAQPVTIQEIVSDPEINDYLDATCRLFPSECINEPTDGKNINDVQLTAGAISGGISVTGPPYTNPITGESQQDKVVIGGSSSGIGVNSGTNSAWEYTPSLGQSITNNTVDVSSVARPDLTGTTDVAKPNNQTGTKPEVIVPPVTVPEFKDLNDMIDFCKANPKASSCLEFEDVEKQQDKDLPEVQETFNLNKLNIFASNGLCPQGSQFTLSFLGTSKNFELSFQPACDFAQKLRYVLIAIAMLIALKIIFGFGGVKK